VWWRVVGVCLVSSVNNNNNNDFGGQLAIWGVYVCVLALLMGDTFVYVDSLRYSTGISLSLTHACVG
jgi:hypothetical protein